MDYNYISTKKCRSNFLRRPQHGGRRSLAGLESVTLRPFPLTSALDPPPPPPPPQGKKEGGGGGGGGGGGASVNVRGDGRRVTDSKPASDLLPPCCERKSEKVKKK